MSSLLAKLYVDAGIQPPEEEKKAPVAKAPAPQAGGSVLPGVYGSIGRTFGPAGELAGRALGGLAAQSQQAQRQAQIQETGRDFAPRPTAGERLSDAGQQLLSGFNSLIVQGAGGLYGIAFQDFENPATKQGRANEESINANLSAATAERKLRADEWIAQRSAKTGNPVVDITSEMVNTIAAYGGDDVLVQDLLIRQLPNLLTGVVGRGAAVAKGASLANKGLTATEIAAKASKTGERVTVGLTSALQGSDVATSAYDRLAGMGPDVWEQDPKYQKMVAAGLDPETAIEKRSGEIAQKVGIASAALSGVLNKYMPTAEKAIAGSKVGKTKAGRVVGTAAGEMASEGLEEGGGQFIQNVGVKSADPTASLSEGVGTAAGLGALAGGPLGAGAGALSGENQFKAGEPDVGTGRLYEAIQTSRGTQPPPSPGQALLPQPEGFGGTFSVGGLQMTADNVLAFAEANKDNNPRIAQILSSDMTQGAPVLEALVKELNTDEAYRAERDVAAAMSNIVDGKTAKSVVMSTLNSAMSSIPQEVVTASPLLSQLSSMTDGKATPKQIGQVISQFRAIVTEEGNVAPRAEGTVFARPVRGGEGSVLMSPQQKSEEAQREREAIEDFTQAAARDKRYEAATAKRAGGGTDQREDLRPGASEPTTQFFLSENHPTNPGAPATIVTPERDGYARVQYETGEVMNGMPVYASEEVPLSGLRSRVIRGSARLTQDFASRQRTLRSGVGTQMEGPRDSIDRASTKQVSVVPEPGTAVEPYITESERIYNSAPEPTPERVGGGVKRIETGTKAIEAKEPPPKGQERVAAPSRKAVGRDKRTGIEYQPEPGDNNISVSREGEATIRDAKTSPPGETERKGQRVIRMGDQTPREESAPKESEPTVEPTKPTSLAKASARLGKMAGLEKGKPVKKSKKADDTQFSRREGQASTFEAAPTIMSEEEAQAEIEAALEKLRGRGKLGRVVANRISSVLKDKSYTVDQVFAAFIASDEVTRVLKGRGDIDVVFSPEVRDGSGLEAEGAFTVLRVSRDGFSGVINLSLAADQIPLIRQTSAHEAFHALQKVLRKADPNTFAALNRSFRDEMTAKDVHASVRRALQGTVNRATGNTFWDEFLREFGDRKFSGYTPGDPNTLTELQAYVFGYLHDAQRFGMEKKGLATQFAKALDFFDAIFGAIGSGLRGQGFTTVSQIFADATSGALSDRTFDTEIEADDGPQYSRRKDFERPRISETKIKVPIPETSSLNILYDDGSPSPKLPTEKMNGGQAAKWIQDRAQRGLRRVFGVDKITGPSPETDRYLSQTIAAEAMAAILKELKTGLRSALDWYTTAVENAITTAAEIYPILGSDAEAARLSNSHGIRTKKDARVIFTLGMSITSQNMAVRDNTRAAVEQMDLFMENVRFDPSKRYGTKAPSIASNLELANTMLSKVFDGDVSRLGEFLDKEFTVGELNAYGRRVQEKLGLEKPPFTVGGELVDQIVYGSAIFGPKIGNGFYQNLNGNFSPITIDLWFMRLWGRLTGTLVGNDAALTLQAQNLRDAVMADDHPTYKVPDGYAQQIEDATDEELVDIAASLFKEWDRTYKSLRKSGVSNEEITSQKMKPRWAFAAARLDAQKKANDAPTGGSQRKWIRSVIQGALTILKKNGYDLTAADLQATIWYPEKDLHSLITKGRLEETLNVSYDTAISEIASQRKSNAPNPDDYAGRRNDDQRRGTEAGQADSGRGEEGAGRGDAGQEAQYSRRATGPDVAGAQAGRLSGRGVVSGGEGLLPAQGGPGLQGLPRRVRIPATGQVITAGPYEAARNAAEEYMRRAGLPYAPPQTYVKVDEDRARRIASAFEQMKDDPFDPEVRASYAAMLKETLEQWEAIKDVVGLSVDFIDVTKGDPYAPSPRLAVEDIVNNNHMWVFSTDSGYGQRGITPEDEARNPLLARTGEIINGIDARANDIFRIVHDFFGHAKEGVGFRADGEENAWRQHVSMYSPAARNAVTVETRGQNSWLNYGPHGDANRNASTEDTIFADQKVGKLPQWVVDEGATDEGADPQYSRRDPRDTPRFNEWFGGSRAVNEDGSPKVYYHGTGRNITRFAKARSANRGLGEGPFFFTDDPVFADDYASLDNSAGGAGRTRRSGGNIMPVYLKAERPFDYENLSDLRKLQSFIRENGTTPGVFVPDGLKARDIEIYEGRAEQGFWPIFESKPVQQWLRDQGYDSFYVVEAGVRNLAVYNPRQVKSVFNMGEWNPQDDRISYSRRDPRANPAFNEWFGGSKVVDGSGAPLMVYTGTSKDTIFNKFKVPGNGTWFTTDPKGASEYALQNDSMDLKPDPDGPNPWSMKKVNTASRVIPAYLKIENPYVISGLEELRKYNESLGEFTYRRGQKILFDRLRSEGYDGVQLEYNGESVWVVLSDPTQIKSPFNQTFNPRDPQFSRRNLEDAYALRSAPNFARTPMNFDGAVDEVGKLDDVVRTLQDKLIDTKRVQSQIEKAGRSISDEQNVYQTEELYHGKATKRSKDFVLRELNPLLKEMGQKGITTDALDKYLHARHAKERNAQIARINPSMPDGGSGMTNAQADSYMAGLAPMRKRQLEALASKVDEMIRETQRMLVSDGLENQTAIDNWNSTYQFYVPLQREDFEEDPQSAGQGMSVRGSTTRRAMGSTLAVSNILSNVAQARERAISRGERNRIGNALMGLALSNPNESFWMVVDPSSKATQTAIDKLVDWGFSPEDAQNIFGPPQKRYIDSKGEVIHRSDRLFADAQNVMATRVNGEDRFIIFNPRNPRSKSMVESLKGLNTAQFGEILGIYGRLYAKGTRYFASINTQYNPVFGMLNLIRDLGGATLNLSTTKIAGKQAAVLADAGPAMMGIYSELRAGRRGEGPSGYWANLADEFESQGGKTGYRELFATPADRAKSIEKELNKDVRNVPMKVAGATFEWLSDFNETIENGVRLSAYKHALDAGLSKAQAASLAKNLTVNFNRKGTVGAQAGALYAFFNASVQGTARLAETLTGPAGRRIVAGGLLLGATQAIMMSMAGIGDDIPEWVKDRNVVIPLGDKKYFTFPLPLGFHAIPATSRRMIEAFTNDKSTAMDVAEMLTMYAEAFNPVGQSSILQTIAPTNFDWIAALAENRDFAGRSIYKKDMNSLDPTPGPDRNRAGVSPLGAMVAIGIDRMTGGTGYSPGAFSPTGDAVDYVVGFFTGGVGREVLKVASTGRALATGEELPVYKVPLVGRFFGNANESFSISSRYYDNITLMNRHEREVDGRNGDGRDTTDYLSKNPEAYLYEEAGNVERQVKALRKQAEQEEDATQKRYLNEEATMLMQEFNQMVADAKRTG